MLQKKTDVTGVGNAIVDVLARSTDAFLDRHRIPKGGMCLTDERQADAVYAGMTPLAEKPGGSAANSMACIASLGGRARFIGKVADDRPGKIFRENLEKTGVVFRTPPLAGGGPGTGRCLVNITPDAQRSMMTFLGASRLLSADDIVCQDMADTKIIFFEGYLFEEPDARAAFSAACRQVRKAGGRTALTLSDAGCVERQHDRLTAFIPEHIDILFANEQEANVLFKNKTIPPVAEKARSIAPLTVITQSENGSLIIPGSGSPVKIPACTPSRLVDTTGAGDAYAGGFLFALARGFSPERAGHLASFAASEIISHVGARPERNLEEPARKKGLL